MFRGTCQTRDQWCDSMKMVKGIHSKNWEWRGEFLCQRNELPRWIRNYEGKIGGHNEGNVFSEERVIFPE